VSPARRHWLALLAAAGGSALSAKIAHAATARADDEDSVRRGRVLRFPRDHGAHLGARTEWWYATGWLARAEGGPAADPDIGAAQPAFGFQITFFRSRTGLAEGLTSRFAARQLLFAHAAVTDLGAKRHHHAQNIARWSGDPAARLASASLADCDVRLPGWSLLRSGTGTDAQSAYRARLGSTGDAADEAIDGAGAQAGAAPGFNFDLRLSRSQPLLLQGEAGYSRKGPDEGQASHYYSEPQLVVTGELRLDSQRLAGQRLAVRGRAWLDHEWSDRILHPEAVGWDWIGINLDDGSALTAFRLRRADGSTLWAGGSFRAAGRPAVSFAPEAVRFKPGRIWSSPSSGAHYPVEWQIETPVGAFALRALMDAQELDGGASTGTVYWEGLSELQGAGGRRVGLGYLEMTGYVAPLKL
jgi:predicted secreted hydrolase